MSGGFRDAVRAVVLDPEDRILLVRFEFPDRGLWATPGGGVDEGETDEEALRRELDEELGLPLARLGPVIWVREHVFEPRWGKHEGQRERYYLLRTAAFEPDPRLTPEELEDEYVFGMRWWTPDELAASTETFAPTQLPQLVAGLIADGPPAEPLALGT